MFACSFLLPQITQIFGVLEKSIRNPGFSLWIFHDVQKSGSLVCPFNKSHSQIDIPKVNAYSQVMKSHQLF